jgi:hypothetical protein
VNKLSLPTTTQSIPIIMSSPLRDIRCTLLCKGVDVVIQDHKFLGGSDSVAFQRHRCDTRDGLDHRSQGCHLHFTATCDLGTP